jgi:hypothetical protein
VRTPATPGSCATAADWDRADWPVLRDEVAAIARLAGELRLWTVLGSVHPLTPPHRPHNSNQPESIDIAVTKARPWRRQARAGIYDAHLVADDRSDDRTAL